MNIDIDKETLKMSLEYLNELGISPWTSAWVVLSDFFTCTSILIVDVV